ncbi:S8 family serine peptidase [Paenibacillus sp. LHD-38]|uniref:S8 family serine peptidase n=1 Tax=Paenibacillus sp. LHD-38 TaxID=3072143 RepID=UPI0028100D74|nr:S8 family serine peptidase [Paenibacillus sp. LHD-38]MDQ8734836.1 S8 family serine peptidase [Paenibacillus sp. LHD-38]
MKKLRLLSLFLTFIILFTTFDVSVFSAGPAKETKSYLVKFVNKSSIDQQLKGKKLKKKFKHNKLASAELSAAELLQLIQSKTVEYIEEDVVIKISAKAATKNAVKDEAMAASVTEAKARGIDGSGVKIAVLDTGITESNQLGVSGGASFVDGVTDYTDDNGHGTYIASLISGNSTEVQGAATGAQLYALKVLDGQAVGSYSDVIEAIEWSVDNKMDIASMSFGADVYSTALADTMAYAYDNGVLLVAAAGNESENLIDYPARFHSVIAVGSVDQNHIRAPFSNIGNELELMATGVEVSGLDSNGATVTKSGTSVSTATVAGVAALYMQAFKGISNVEIRELMNASALYLGDVREYGNGLARFAAKKNNNDQPLMTEEQENEWIKQEIVKQEEKAKQRDAAKKQKEEKKKKEKEDAKLAAEKKIVDTYEEERERPDTSQRELSERIQRKLAKSEANFDQIDLEDTATRNIEVLAEEWGISVKDIQKQLDKGFTLEEIETAIHRYKQNKTSLQYEIDKLAKKQINASKQAKSEIQSDLGSMNLKEANLFRAATVPTEPEAPQLDMLNLKTGEAPYRVNLESESVSTLSGSLSVSASDFTLPGRNGNGFTLTRTYDSGGSQYYDMEPALATNVSTIYYVAVSGMKTTQYTTFYLDYNYHIIKAKYACSTGALVTTYSDTWSSLNHLDYTTQAARDSASNNVQGSYTVTDADQCAQYDRITKTKYNLSKSTYNTNSVGGIETDIHLFLAGPYQTLASANEVKAAYITSKGQVVEYIPPNGNPNSQQISYTKVISDAEVISAQSTNSYYYNNVVDAKDEKKFPIGKGWTWNIPYLTFSGGTYVHLAGSGTYKVENQTLKGYPYKDVQLVSDTTVNVHGVASAYALKLRAGGKQYFDSNGLLLQISDAYKNHTQFKYADVSPYGKVLTEISDAIGNKIVIAYTSTQVMLTMGDRQVIYKKTTQNNKELLTQVIDPLQRTTTYDYHVASAKFNLLGSDPYTTNPYALLTGVTHPTGAKTVYEYEGSPVKRYTSTNSVNEVYRVAVRKDILTYSDNTNAEFNRASFLYPQDIGSTYNHDITFTTKLMRGEVVSIYTYKKDYIDDNTAPMFYNTKIEAFDLAINRVTEKTYDEINRNPYPISTTNYFVSGVGESTRVVSSAQYDTWGNVISETDPLGNQSTYTHDSVSHLLTSALTPVGGGKSLYVQLTRNNQNDVIDYSIRENNASGVLLRKRTYTYDTFGNITLAEQHGTDRKSQTAFTYDVLSAFPIKASYSYKDADEIARTSYTEATYDVRTGATKTINDGKGNVTEYIRDNLDRVNQVINPDLTKVIITYDDVNNQIITTNEANKKSVVKWNGLGLQVESGIIENGVYVKKSRSGYDGLSRNNWIEDASGNRVVNTYDNWNRVQKTTKPDGSFITTNFDDIAYRTIVTDEENNSSLSKYDQYGRLMYTQSQKNGAFVTTRSYTYDQAGKVRTTQDALNHVTEYIYDVLGQLTAVKNAKNETTTYQYDPFGNMTAIIYPDGSNVQKKFDELGRLKQQTDQAGKIKKIYYDAAGNMERFIDRKGISFTYTYDSRNMLTDRSSPSEIISYAYTTDGLRKSMTDQTGKTEYTYDQSTGQLTELKYPDGKAISYTYEGRGNLSTITGPFSHSSAYEYDNLNRMETVTTDTEQNVAYSYLKNDQISNIEMANGIKTEYTYNGLELTQLQHKSSDGLVINSYNYSYDLTGNTSQKSENGTSQQYSYDVLGRIQTNTQFSETYEYDAKGNRFSLVSDALPEIDAVSYEYDDWNRLKKATTSEGVITYKYNGDDRLVERTENGETTRYYWSNDQIIAEGTVQGTTVTEKATYVYGLSLIERIDGQNANRSSYLMNGHGDVVELRDEQGNIQNQYSYDIWGNPITESETVDNPFRYSGEYWDESTELQYLRARWYDPSTARFINEDTYEGELGNPLSHNLYTYVHNNPLIYVDPTGHWNEKLGFNYVINEMKNMWSVATTTSERDYWSSEAEKIRTQARNAGYSNSNIMQSTDKMIPMEEIMKRAHEMFPALSAVQGFTEGLSSYVENHPGEGAAISTGMGIFAFGKISKLEKGLNFTVTTTTRMETAGRFVPVQTLISAIKYGNGLPDPRGSKAIMYYTEMYKTQSKSIYDPALGYNVTVNYVQKYNLEVLYDSASNTVYHFEYTRDAIGPLGAIK